ncbi:hypothetical protein ACFX11_007202 [Malus domestica]
MPHHEELSDECGQAGHAAMVASELDQGEEEDAKEGANGRDVEKQLDVAVPGLVGIGTVDGGRRKRESVIHGGDGGEG